MVLGFGRRESGETRTALVRRLPQPTIPRRVALPRPGAVVSAVVATPRTLVSASALARIAGSTVVRGANWVGRGAVSTTAEITRELATGAPIIEILETQVEAARWAAWQFLGLDESLTADHRARARSTGTSLAELRARGDRLIRRSADDTANAGQHPAFARILDELVPDEARIMRFMAMAGPQPAVDVRTKTPFGVGSEPIKTGINMIADMAGCTHVDRGHEYLGNLNRLGLVHFSHEPVSDPRRYSFIEAQPVTAAAIDSVKRAYTVYRSIEISSFGKQFCDVCFTLDDYDAGGWIRDVR